MGTPDFAVPSLKAIVEAGHEVVAVFTQPDKPKNRGKQMSAPPIKELALELGIDVHQPTKMRDGTVMSLIKEYAPDLIAVVAYGRILPKDIIDYPKYGCINVHGSLLPKYRGAGPIQWSVIDGCETVGITTMIMGEGLDTGDMLLKYETPLKFTETYGELHDRLSLEGAKLLVETIDALEKGSVTPEPQQESEATHAPMLDKKMSQLDFTKEPLLLHNLIRGINPWPMARFTLDGKVVKVIKAVPVEGYTGKAGELLDDKRLIVACGSGAIELLEVQPESKGKMEGKAFLMGKRLEKGTILG